MSSAICFSLDQSIILSSRNGLKHFVPVDVPLANLYYSGDIPLIYYLSHNKLCFQCNIAITNFLVSNTCEIRFHDVMGQSSVPMYSYAKILKHG